MTSLAFWNMHQSTYLSVWQFAHDLVATPASRVYDEQVFFSSGNLCMGKRNCTLRNLKMHMFVQKNKSYCA